MLKDNPFILFCVLAMGAFVAAAFLPVNVIYIVIACALFGLVSSFVAERRVKK